MVNIFEYQNYRLYLKDYYNDQKNAKKYFSYRYFSKKAGINASAFLYYVINGKRNLTKSSIGKISTAIGHSKEENDFFENLVFFNQARTIAEKVTFYSRIVECKKPLDMKIVDKDQYEYYATWHHSVMREIACMADFKDDFGLLGSYLTPAITAKEARSSLSLLERLGLVERDDDGRYHQTDAIIGAKTAGRDAFVIEKFQIEMLDLAKRSFDVVPRAERLSASTTFSISKDTFELFKIRTREFRKELLEIAKLDTEADSVYQFTFNLFPVARSADDERK